MVRPWCGSRCASRCASREMPCTFSTSQLSKVVRTWCTFTILTSKCASRHNAVHFFDVATAKSGPNKRRALFRYRNCHKWSDRGVLWTFWLRNVLHARSRVHFWAAQLNFQTCLGNSLLCAFALRNVLRATTACTFSTSQLPKVLRTWNVLHILLGNMLRTTTRCTFWTSQLPKVVPSCGFDLAMRFAPVSRVLFSYISTSKSAPTMRCFWHFHFKICCASQRRAIFHLSSHHAGAPKHWNKNTVFCDFSTLSIFAHVHLLSSDWFWLFLLSCLIFFLIPFSSLFLFSDIFLLPFTSLALPTFAFPSVHVVGRLTSKLPSIIKCTFTYKIVR